MLLIADSESCGIQSSSITADILHSWAQTVFSTVSHSPQSQSMLSTLIHSLPFPGHSHTLTGFLVFSLVQNSPPPGLAVNPICLQESREEGWPTLLVTYYLLLDLFWGRTPSSSRINGKNPASSNQCRNL